MQASGTYPYVQTRYNYFMRPEKIEPVLRRNQKKIAEFGWISFERKNSFESGVTKSILVDISTTYKSD